jgi:hypothetical protein
MAHSQRTRRAFSVGVHEDRFKSYRRRCRRCARHRPYWCRHPGSGWPPACPQGRRRLGEHRRHPPRRRTGPPCRRQSTSAQLFQAFTVGAAIRILVQVPCQAPVTGARRGAHARHHQCQTQGQSSAADTLRNQPATHIATYASSAPPHWIAKIPDEVASMATPGRLVCHLSAVHGTAAGRRRRHHIPRARLGRPRQSPGSKRHLQPLERGLGRPRSIKIVGHEGLEPSTNGLRIHCSTN